MKSHHRPHPTIAGNGALRHSDCDGQRILNYVGLKIVAYKLGTFLVVHVIWKLFYEYKSRKNTLAQEKCTWRYFIFHLRKVRLHGGFSDFDTEFNRKRYKNNNSLKMQW